MTFGGPSKDNLKRFKHFRAPHPPDNFFHHIRRYYENWTWNCRSRLWRSLHPNRGPVAYSDVRRYARSVKGACREACTKAAKLWQACNLNNADENNGKSKKHRVINNNNVQINDLDFAKDWIWRSFLPPLYDIVSSFLNLRRAERSSSCITSYHESDVVHLVPERHEQWSIKDFRKTYHQPNGPSPDKIPSQAFIDNPVQPGDFAWKQGIKMMWSIYMWIHPMQLKQRREAWFPQIRRMSSFATVSS